MWQIIATILVLAITAIATIAVFDSYNTSQQQMTVQNVQSALGTTISTINTAFAQNRNYSGFNGNIAKSIGAVPQSWSDLGSGSFAIPSGGRVSFASTSINGGNNNAYQIIITDIGKQLCAGLGTFAVPQMVRIEVNGTVFENPAYIANASGAKWPPVGAQVSAACSKDAGNQITFTLM